ncbi:hypothetical protein AC1031_018025 [Aphanomyces cochlioides]|nr:hypothetical protein AC1031_018025 [Aphanomyces cochlioides]
MLRTFRPSILVMLSGASGANNRLLSSSVGRTFPFEINLSTMLSFLGLTSTASPAKPTSAPQQTTQTQEQKNANPHSAQQHKTQVKPVTPQQTTKQDQKHAKTQDNKQHQSKQQKNATAPTKAVGPTKQTETPKQNQTSKAAPVQQPTKTKSMTPAQQLEMQQILNILIDDAGIDWKPRNKTVKPHAFTKRDSQKQGGRPTSAKPKQKTPAQKATTHSPRPKTSSAATSRPVLKMTLTPAQQVEMQQILNILIDDAGKDWRPRNVTTWPWSPKNGSSPKTTHKAKVSSKPVAKKNTASKVKAPTKSSVVKPAKPLHRRRSLTDAQKREKRAIMEILLEPYEYVPAPVRPRSSTVQLHAELDHKVGNVVVVSNQAVDASEDLSGFETVKSRRTNFQEKKEFRQEIGDMMSILIDWTEPLPKKQAKQTPKKKTPQKAPTPTKTQTPTKSAAQAKTQPVSKPQTPSKPQDTPKTQNKTTQEAAKPQTPKKAPKSQTAQQQKAPPATTHIQANKNQRAKLTT